MTARKYIDNAPQVTLTASIDTSATAITVSSLIGFPTQFPYYAVLDIGTSSSEVVKVTGATGPTVTVTRNANGLGAFAHTGTSGTFTHAAVALDYQEANDHINATTGVHGLAAGVAPVGVTSTQTLTNKTLTSPSINGGTITGATLTNPTITGTNTVATSHVTGNETVGGTLGVTGATTLAGVTAGAVSAGATTVSTLTASGQIKAPSKLAPNEVCQLNFRIANGDQGIVAGTNTVAGFDAVYNTLGAAANFFSTQYQSIVIPAGKGGTYRVSGQVCTDSNQGRVHVGITKNAVSSGWVVSNTELAPGSGNIAVPFGPYLTDFAAGDEIRLIIDLQGYTGPGANVHVGTGLPNTFLLLERIA